jgi:hypothetical protein
MSAAFDLFIGIGYSGARAHMPAEPRVNGEEALKVHRLIDRLLQSAG